MIEPNALYGCEVWVPLSNQDFIKWDKHHIETLHAEFYKSILKVQRKTPNNACRSELGRCPIAIKIQKRALQLYNHLKESDSNTLHNKALTHRELHPEKCPLSQLVLGICPNHINEHIRQNQIIRKQKEKFLAHWIESTKSQ